MKERDQQWLSNGDCSKCIIENACEQNEIECYRHKNNDAATRGKEYKASFIANKIRNKLIRKAR